MGEWLLIAQVTVGGLNPQLPPKIGPNGGLQVECIAGTCTGGGGGAGGDVNITGVGGNVVTTTVPISTLAPIAVTQSGAWTVGISGSVAVTGTFWQATQPVSGTFWQATQPVSGTFWPTAAASPASNRLSTGAAFYDARDRNWTITETVPVSGTFWQATQPVSGTFWQATQPVDEVSESTVYTGTLAATTTAAAVGSSQTIKSILVQNDPDNSVHILCGNASAQNIQLAPGAGLSMDVTNVNLIYCKTVSGSATVAFIAR